MQESVDRPRWVSLVDSYGNTEGYGSPGMPSGQNFLVQIGQKGRNFSIVVLFFLFSLVMNVVDTIRDIPQLFYRISGSIEN